MMMMYAKYSKGLVWPGLASCPVLLFESESYLPLSFVCVMEDTNLIALRYVGLRWLFLVMQWNEIQLNWIEVSDLFFKKET